MLRNPIVFLTTLVSFSFLLPSCAAPPPKAIKKNANKSQVKASDVVRKPAQAKPYISPYIARTVDSWTGNDKPNNYQPSKDNSWLQENLSGNDVPFKSIRTEINEGLQTKQLTLADIKKYQVVAENNPQNAESIFRFAYANYMAQKVPSIHVDYVVSSGLFAYAVSPNTYNYTRLRFLIAANANPSLQFRSLGEKLLRKNHKDYDVQYILIRCLEQSKSKVDIDRALLLAKNLIHTYPDKSSAYSGLGGIYFTSWYTSRNPSDGAKAIAAYQQYLRIASNDDAWRPQAHIMINYIKNHSPVK